MWFFVYIFSVKNLIDLKIKNLRIELKKSSHNCLSKYW